MESPTHIIFSRVAFMRAMVHACKHPTTPVYGVLLASPLSEDKTLRIEHAVPLFHETPMGPLLEVAMTMINKVCTEKGLVPVGIYFGSDHYYEDRVSAHAESIAANFSGKGGPVKNAILAVIKASELADPQGQPIDVYEGHGSAFKSITDSKCEIEELQKANDDLTALLTDGKLAVADFNDHIVTTAPFPVLS